MIASQMKGFQPADLMVIANAADLVINIGIVDSEPPVFDLKI